MLNLLLYFSLAFAQVGTRSVKDIDIARGQTSFKNYVKNPDQEVVGTFVPFVTASGGSLTVETSAPIDGKSIRIDSSASAQTYKWDLKPYDTRFGELSGQQCYVEFQYSMAGANANPNRDGYKWYVEDGSGNKLTSETQLISTYDELAVADGPPRLQQNWFVCPAIPLTWKFVIESTASDATRLIVDNIKLGLDFKIGQVSNSGIIARATSVGTSLCIWLRTADSWGSFTADPDCPSLTSLFGNADQPATKIPAIKVNNIIPGWYKVTATGWFQATTNQDFAFRIFDGTDGLETQGYNNQNSGVTVGGFGQIVGFIQYNQTYSSKTFEIQGRNATSESIVRNDRAGVSDLNFTVEYLGPSIGAVGVSQQDWGPINLGPATLTANTPPGKGTVATDNLWCSRRGTDLECRYEFDQTGSGTAGSGEYRLVIPTAAQCTIDSTKVTFDTGVITDKKNSVGFVSVGSTAANTKGKGFFTVFSASELRFTSDINNANTDAFVGAAWFPLSNTSVSYTGWFKVPCSNYVVGLGPYAIINSGGPIATRTVTSNYTISVADYVVLSNGTSLTHTLPPAALQSGKVLIVKNINSSPATLDGNASETIDGNLTLSLTQHTSLTIISDGTNWRIL